MNDKIWLLRRGFTLLMLGAVGTSLSNVVWAEDEEVNEIEEVVVTGSRIVRSNVDSTSPITILVAVKSKS